jgi:flagellar motor switch protein FliN/FliY
VILAVIGDDLSEGVAADSTAPAIPDDEGSPFAALEAEGESQEEVQRHVSTVATEAPRLDLVLDIPVRLSVELGRTEISIREVVNLGRGSMIELDRSAGEPLDVRVNGVLIGRGEVVVINEDRLGLRFTEVVSHAERVKRLS